MKIKKTMQNDLKNETERFKEIQSEHLRFSTHVISKLHNLEHLHEKSDYFHNIRNRFEIMSKEQNQILEDLILSLHEIEMLYNMEMVYASPRDKSFKFN